MIRLSLQVLIQVDAWSVVRILEILIIVFWIGFLWARVGTSYRASYGANEQTGLGTWIYPGGDGKRYVSNDKMIW